MNKYIVDLVKQDAIKHGFGWVKNHNESGYLIYNSDLIDFGYILFADYLFKIKDTVDGNEVVIAEHESLDAAIKNLKDIEESKGGVK